ncbi:MAG: SMP-30/gluconolactonase/LRE family protein [Acidobacteria bacterium]|nr:SMP-30/gluconolactonase/LRE family protein [Acidobacteriota bacterium]
MHKSAFILIFAAILASACGQPAPLPDPGPATIPMPSAVLEAGAEVSVALNIVFTEGPAADAEGNVYYSEITSNRIIKYMPGGEWSEFRRPSRRANGLAFDPQGRLLACEGGAEGGGRQVTRTDMASGKVEVLADNYEGKKLNSPNDITLSREGRIYFTDPRYGAQDGRELDTEDVYMIDTNGTLSRVLTKPDITKPNGIGISPDGKTLYVADTTDEPREARVMAFDLAADGTPSNGRKHYSFGTGRGIDGMTIDTEGNIYGAAGNNNNPPENLAGVYVISPQGQLIGRIPIPEDSATNCTFGGKDLRTLYVTAGKTLYQIRTKNPGSLVYPPL